MTSQEAFENFLKIAEIEITDKQYEPGYAPENTAARSIVVAHTTYLWCKEGEFTTYSLAGPNSSFFTRFYFDEKGNLADYGAWE